MRKLVLITLSLLLVAGCRKSEKPAASAPPSTAKTAAAPGTPAGAPATGVAVGAAMPSYSARRLDGSPFELSGEKGKVVFVNIWAMWCGPCRAEIPELQKLHDRYAARRFEVLGISVDEGTADEVRKFVQEEKMTYPVALDPEAKIANLLETNVLPTSVLLDRSGKIVWKSFGQVDLADPALQKALEAALGS